MLLETFALYVYDVDVIDKNISRYTHYGNIAFILFATDHLHFCNVYVLIFLLY